MTETLVHQLLHTAAESDESNRLTFIDRRERETPYHWSEVAGRARRAAGSLSKAGVKKGDCVGIILPTGVEFMDALFGCQLLGAVPVPMYPPVRLGRLEEYYSRTAVMLKKIEAVALVTDTRISRLMGRVFERYQPRLGRISSEKLAEGKPGPLPDVVPDDLAMVQFSSGTTVAPKPVALTHRQVLANVRVILDHLPLDAGFKQSGVSWLPLYHDMGLIGCVFTAITAPGPLALIPPEAFLAKPSLWLCAISRHKATVSPAPNFAYALCVERVADDHLDGIDLSSWRLALNGAEPVSVASLTGFRERFSKWGLRAEALTPVYGLAEAALAVTFSDPTKPFVTSRFDRECLADGRAVPGEQESIEMVSVGVPLKGFLVEIRDDRLSVLEQGNVGVIWVRGPSIMSGYLNVDEQPIRDGWLNTGDIGFIHQEQLFISGRAKDVLVLRGQNHSPHELEHAVDHIEGVRMGCSAAVSDFDADSERIVVFVEYRVPRESLAEDCRQAVLERTGINPDLVVLLESGTLPRTSSGKIRRREALRLWKAGDLRPPEKVTPWLIVGALAGSAFGFLRSRR